MSSTELVDPAASVRSYLEAEKADNTRRGYKADWKGFTTWCKSGGFDPLPAAPITVAKYISWLADQGRKSTTIQRQLSGIAAAHKAAGLESPTISEGVKATMRGIRRTLRSPKTKKAPSTAPVLATVIAQLPNTLAGLRDRAILLIGFAAALRRSELASLNLEHIDRKERGILVHLGRTKSDQEGKGTVLPIPNGKTLKPVEALDVWLEASGIADGPLFREVDRHGNVGATALSGGSIARIVKRAVKAAGFDEKRFSGHSMRAGFITSALEGEVDILLVKKQSRHVKVDTLAEYDRRENDFDDSAGSGFL